MVDVVGNVLGADVVVLGTDVVAPGTLVFGEDVVALGRPLLQLVRLTARRDATIAAGIASATFGLRDRLLSNGYPVKVTGTDATN